MLATFGRHVRHNIVGYVALLAALSSSAYAGADKLLPRNSVGTKQVINNSLLNRDFKRGQVPRGKRGLSGPKGATGPAGANGLNGANGATSVVIRLGTPDVQTGAVFAQAFAHCHPGEHVTGGGGYIADSGGAASYLKGSRPIKTEGGIPAEGETPVAWEIESVNTVNIGSTTLTPYVVCAAP